MTLSLDTHVFLWWLDDPQLLSKAARKAIGDGKNTVYASGRRLGNRHQARPRQARRPG